MVDSALRAIAEPHRREILKLVREKELSAGEIASHFDLTRPAISQHLRALSEAELVSIRKEGTKRMYRARPEKIEELVRYLDQFWDQSLAKLKREAEAEQRRRGRRDEPGC